MSLFDPVTLPGLSETSTPVIRRAFHRARIIGNFAVIQAFVQVLSFLSGILVVRWLTQREYAYFTIANSMQGTINLLADIGISVGLLSIGGRVWQDRHRFGELINTALRVRRKLGAVAILIVTPLMCFMLIKNGAPTFYTALLVGVVIAGLLLQFSIGVLGVVPRLLSDIRRIQIIDLTTAVVRLALLTAFAFIVLDAGVAVAVATAAYFLQYLMVRHYVRGVVDLTAPENEQDRQEIVRLTRHLAANAVFYCFQGQITVFLISFFARHVSSIAEVGALGRLAMIFAVFSNLLTNVFVPAFARCQDPLKLRWLYAAILGGVTAFSLLILAGAAMFPDQFLFILGNKYAHLHRELLLMIGASVIAALTGTFWDLNASKAWVRGSWLYIPLTLTVQVALIPFTDFSSVHGVLTFNLLSAVPNLFLNIALSYRGLRDFSGDNPLRPNFGYHVARLQGNVMRQLYRIFMPWIVRCRVEPRRKIDIDVFAYSNEAMLPEQVVSIRSFLRHVGRPRSFTVVSDGSHSPRSLRLLEHVDLSVAVRQPVPASPELPEKLRAYLENHPTGKQLSLIMSLPVRDCALYVDSDIRFFAGAADLVERVAARDAPACYLVDCAFAGDERLLRDEVEKEKPVNTGVLLLFEKLDWSPGLNRFLEMEGAPDFFTNQTITHLAMHQSAARPLDPAKYVLQRDDEFVYRDHYSRGDIVLRHYVNPVRHKFWTSLLR
jgi:O-antigen/teichoic acid export membrane protein